MSEIDDLIATFDEQSTNFRTTAEGLTEEQARATPTASELSIGGLVKHVTFTHRHWWKVIADADPTAQFDMEAASTTYALSDDETLADWLAHFDDQREKTAAALRALDDPDAAIPLPVAPWAPDPQYRSARWIVLNMLRELAHHSGHADILRETIDGQSTTVMQARAAGMDI
ncbi:DinB family protein [Gordonia neofelifaecis]|uniref:DinB family protein n=1 Tax=Gordonia neofelifaecis NRRL B-59395 TaxID=644548 RepID=F1YLM4_9ACTN|nr:DinB family protein [Gordonia neofelifaecis]EGD54418.1 hypothetical protein SCNU_14079 [Gordonia neofelifaecis NRRL B-59395]